VFGSASAPPSGLRSSRPSTLNINVPKGGPEQPPKWAKPSCDSHESWPGT